MRYFIDKSAAIEYALQEIVDNLDDEIASCETVGEDDMAEELRDIAADIRNATADLNFNFNRG